MTPREVSHLLSPARGGEPRAARPSSPIVDPYTLLVAVILSAQATDVGVNKATEELFKVAARPKRCWRSARTG